LAWIGHVPLTTAAKKITLQLFQLFLKLGQLSLLVVAGDGRLGQHGFGVRQRTARGKQFTLASFQILRQGGIHAHAGSYTGCDQKFRPQQKNFARWPAFAAGILSAHHPARW
jgi:hypothetical protein